MVAISRAASATSPFRSLAEPQRPLWKVLAGSATGCGAMGAGPARSTSATSKGGPQMRPSNRYRPSAGATQSLEEELKSKVSASHWSSWPLVPLAAPSHNDERNSGRSMATARRPKPPGGHVVLDDRTRTPAPIRRAARSHSGGAASARRRQPIRRTAACHRTSGSAMRSRANGPRSKPRRGRPMAPEPRTIQ